MNEWERERRKYEVEVEYVRRNGEWNWKENNLTLEVS